MIVVDASAVIEALIGEPNASLATRLSDEDVLHAPHLLDTEVLHVIRRLEHRKDLTPERAAACRTLFDELAIDRYPHRPLSDRVWDLRTTLSAYDATYVALAEALDATLVTVDRRLGAAPGMQVAIEIH